MMKYLKTIVELLTEIKELLLGKEDMSDLEKTYKEYKFFADSRGIKMLSEIGLLDEYNSFMTDCENYFANDGVIIDSFDVNCERIQGRIELPKPSAKLEAFKNKFNKFF